MARAEVQVDLLNLESVKAMVAQLAAARAARSRLRSVLAALAPRLSEPYSDEPRLTSWDRYIVPAMAALDAALDNTDPPKLSTSVAIGDPIEAEPSWIVLERVCADIADEADWIAKRGGMISAAWVADAMRHLAEYGHRRPRAGESTHIHYAPWTPSEPEEKP